MDHDKNGNGGGGGKLVDHGLKGAIDQLNKQHPQKWNDLGPHHHSDDYKRHMPISSSTYKGKC